MPGTTLSKIVLKTVQALSILEMTYLSFSLLSVVILTILNIVRLNTARYNREEKNEVMMDNNTILHSYQNWLEVQKMPAGKKKTLTPAIELFSRQGLNGTSTARIPRKSWY